MNRHEPIPEKRSLREAGFTLLEVLIAFTVLSIVMSAMANIVGTTLARLGSTRIDQEAVRLGEQKMREITALAGSGEPPKVGVEEGVFEGTDTQGLSYAFTLEVEPYAVPLPEGFKPEQVRGSGIFTGREAAGNAPPPIRRVTLRVYPEGDLPERALPFVLFLTEPAEAPEAGPGDPNDPPQDSEDGSDDGSNNVNDPDPGSDEDAS